ncbi:MAG: hypothetical protein AB9903_00955 [Vulcanimicrobiota bacterium]
MRWKWGRWDHWNMRIILNSGEKGVRRLRKLELKRLKVISEQLFRIALDYNPLGIMEREGYLDLNEYYYNIKTSS